jgi:hypothetical protein
MNVYKYFKNKKSLVFDVISKYDDIILKKWFNTKTIEINICQKLPELEEEGDRYWPKANERNECSSSSSSRFNSIDRHYRRDNNDRFRNNKSYGESEQKNKRKHDQVTASKAPKKRIKFDN